MNALKLMATELFILFLASLKGYSQSLEIYTDERGNRYAAISSKGMVAYKVENRSENPNFRKSIQLFKFTSTGQNTEAEKDTDGNDIYVYRTTRHTDVKNECDKKVAGRFIISPVIVDADGKASAAKMDWATANGYLATAKTTDYTAVSYAVSKGCAMYCGKDGKDEPGTWRVPTRGECALILLFYKKMEEKLADDGFKPFPLSTEKYGTYYWTATEKDGNSSEVWSMAIFPDDQISGYTLSNIYQSKSSGSYYLRCIRDIPSE